MKKFYDIAIKEINKETEDTVSVLFDIPDELKEEFKFIPGQFVAIDAEVEGEKLRRDYSICSPAYSDEIRIAIKAVSGGRFSNYANDKLKEGDVLKVAPPEGKFILNAAPGNKKNYLAVVAGSGITPVFSMIQTVLETEKESKFILVYGNKSKEKTIFKDQLDELSVKYGDRFQIIYVFSKQLSEGALAGRIDEEKINDIVQNSYGGLNFDNVFLCGPEEMIDSVKKGLAENNISKDKIHFELFTPSKKEEHTDTDLSGTAEITIILDEEEVSFEMSKKDFILNAALKKNIDAPYSCQGGVCSSCLARVTEGKAVMIKNSVLNDSEIEEGLILTCQAHPVTSKITVDFDDV
jgi:ring-1,2-phenylacetyl-CoA epoxidase subunit PaaE